MRNTGMESRPRKDHELAAQLFALERRLFEPDVRASRRELDRLIADDFLEFAATGASFGKSEALSRLPQEDPPQIEAWGFELRRLTADVAQVVYRARLERPGDVQPRFSRRSSLWRRRGDEWQMVFHQGTPCAPPGDGSVGGRDGEERSSDDRRGYEAASDRK
ncbi:MAG: nuclear transport factor 2 family protein [Holophagales bacterium]|nr:nuclear transport factor 2 family protein [Holophagales bacterium]